MFTVTGTYCGVDPPPSTYCPLFASVVRAAGDEDFAEGTSACSTIGQRIGWLSPVPASRLLLILTNPRRCLRKPPAPGSLQL